MHQKVGYWFKSERQFKPQSGIEVTWSQLAHTGTCLEQESRLKGTAQLLVPAQAAMARFSKRLGLSCVV
eukprot:1336774-Amphidinium_carterae.1